MLQSSVCHKEKIHNEKAKKQRAEKVKVTVRIVKIPKEITQTNRRNEFYSAGDIDEQLILNIKGKRKLQSLFFLQSPIAS